MDFAKITIFHVDIEGACDNVKVTHELPWFCVEKSSGPFYM